MSVTAKDASTVMLMRESGSGLEIYLTRRRDDLRFMAGFYVFTGGKVDEEDSSPGILNRCAGLDMVSPISRRDENQVSVFSLSLYIAACRELFEESGVLLAQNDNGMVLGYDIDPPTELSSVRLRVLSGFSFLEALTETDLYLRPDLLTYFSHWVTPPPSSIRYSARFFGALLPPSFNVSYSKYEATSDCWLSPDEALDRYYSGRLPMIPPTLSGIQSAAGCKSYSEWRDKVASFNKDIIYT